MLQDFRPLDGESISKQYLSGGMDEVTIFPSPRRGINF